MKMTGTFNDGEEVPAICKKEGREVTSRPDLRERPRSSKVWIKIDGTPGVVQFATMTYASMAAADLAALPQCPNE